jgi:hypothetical protein
MAHHKRRADDHTCSVIAGQFQIQLASLLGDGKNVFIMLGVVNIRSKQLISGGCLANELRRQQRGFRGPLTVPRMSEVVVA